ncbi:MAG: M15 family metallopeptidase [Micrococcaceae bacterium]
MSMVGKEFNGNIGRLFATPLNEKNIPAGSWYSLPIVEDHNPLVPLGPYSCSFDGSHELFTMGVYYGEYSNSPYFGKKLNGALLGMYMRQEAAEQLVSIQRQLPEGYAFVLFDAYRDYDVQKSLHEEHIKLLKELHPEWDEAQLLAATEPFIAYPSIDFSKPAPHNTGGTVDLALFHMDLETARRRQQLLNTLGTMAPTADERAKTEQELATLLLTQGQQLDFGTPFDDATTRAKTTYFEELAIQGKLSSSEQECLKNRRFFTHTMEAHNFQVLESEWWHYNHIKTQSGAFYSGQTHAQWGPAVFDEKCTAHEALRQERYQQLSGTKRETEHLASNSLGRYPVYELNPT